MGIILIPDRTILMKVIDDINSNQAKAFDKMIDLKSFCDFEISIPSQMSTKLNKRFDEEHRASFYSHVRVDYSTEGTDGYDSYTSYKWLVPNKAKNLRNTVIFVADNVEIYSLPPAGQGNVVYYTSETFIELVMKIMDILSKVPLDVPIEDTLIALLRSHSK